MLICKRHINTTGVPTTHNYIIPFGQKFPAEESGYASGGVLLEHVDWIVGTPCSA